jgi:hypothetical protein
LAQHSTTKTERTERARPFLLFKPTDVTNRCSSCPGQRTLPGPANFFVVSVRLVALRWSHNLAFPRKNEKQPLKQSLFGGVDCSFLDNNNNEVNPRALVSLYLSPTGPISLSFSVSLYTTTLVKKISKTTTTRPQWTLPGAFPATCAAARFRGQVSA